jgi:hypothetical protein
MKLCSVVLLIGLCVGSLTAFQLDLYQFYVAAAVTGQPVSLAGYQQLYKFIYNLKMNDDIEQRFPIITGVFYSIHNGRVSFPPTTIRNFCIEMLDYISYTSCLTQ